MSFLPPHPSICDGRLTLTTATAVTTSDVTGAGTLYFTPFQSSNVSLYNGFAWVNYRFSEVSLSLTLTSGKNYDVFLYSNGGVLTLELSSAWTNDTTRADALTTQNGVYVKSGATTRRYLGSLRASGTNTAEDSAAKRYLWNLYNQQPRSLLAFDTTDSWTYTTGAYREANNGSTEGTSRVGVVLGLASALVQASVRSNSSNISNSNRASGIGIDSSTVNSAQLYTIGRNIPMDTSLAEYQGYPGIGYHTVRWLEYSEATGTTTWRGDAAVTYVQSGLFGTIWG